MTGRTCAHCHMPPAWSAWTVKLGWHELCHKHHQAEHARLVASLTGGRR